MVSRRAALMCALSCACGPGFDAARAQTITVGEARDRVQSVMGRPDHMAKTLEDEKRCVERWTYGDETRDAFFVEFDDSGRVCTVTFGHR